MSKYLIVVGFVFVSITQADELPKFVSDGVYVSLSGRLRPQIFYSGSSGVPDLHYLDRKDGDGPRCKTASPEGFKLENFQNAPNLFVQRAAKMSLGIVPIADGSFFFYWGEKVLEGTWDATKSKFVRVGDKKRAHQMLSDIPYCEKLSGEAKPAPLPPSRPAAKTDPLILDLGGKGINIGVPRQAVHFDIDADGFTDKLTWPDDPSAHFLVIDRNGNGLIDNGTELFGTVTSDAWGRRHSNGFGALRSFDSNEDGWIDARDGIFDSLQLWNDTNRSGTTDEGELHGLCELNVAAVSLSCTEITNGDDYGNCKTHESVVRMNNKANRKMYEVLFIRPN